MVSSLSAAVSAWDALTLTEQDASTASIQSWDILVTALPKRHGPNWEDDRTPAEFLLAGLSSGAIALSQLGTLQVRMQPKSHLLCNNRQAHELLDLTQAGDNRAKLQNDMIKAAIQCRHP
jgi:hypothetical protein